MPKYRYTVVFEADDDDDANDQVYGDPDGSEEGANSGFHSIVRESLEDADSGRRL